MQLCDSFILRARGLWGLTDAAFDGDFGLLVLGYSGGGNLSGRMLRGHVSGDVNMGQTITVVRAGDGGRASEASTLGVVCVCPDGYWPGSNEPSITDATGVALIGIEEPTKLPVAW